jgi:hypothetical protein
VVPGDTTFYLVGDASSYVSSSTLYWTNFIATFVPSSIAMPVVVAKPEPQEQKVPEAMRIEEGLK